MFSQEARLCDGTQPSKVARTMLEPGPASLAKSLPVKSVNPTCSDEGISSDTRGNHAPLVTSSIGTSVHGGGIIRKELDLISQSLLCDVQNFSNEAPTISADSFMEADFGKTLNLICENKSRAARSVYEKYQPNNRITSDTNSFMELFDRYKIRIPNYDDSAKKQKKKRKGLKRSSRKQKPKKKFPCETHVLSMRQLKNTSRCVTKLLILNLYLRYLEKEKYSLYDTDIE